MISKRQKEDSKTIFQLQYMFPFGFLTELMKTWTNDFRKSAFNNNKEIIFKSSHF